MALRESLWMLELRVPTLTQSGTQEMCKLENLLARLGVSICIYTMKGKDEIKHKDPIARKHLWFICVFARESKMIIITGKLLTQTERTTWWPHDLERTTESTDLISSVVFTTNRSCWNWLMALHQLASMRIFRGKYRRPLRFITLQKIL